MASVGKKYGELALIFIHDLIIGRTKMLEIECSTIRGLKAYGKFFLLCFMPGIVCWICLALYSMLTSPAGRNGLFVLCLIAAATLLLSSVPFFVELIKTSLNQVLGIRGIGLGSQLELD